MGAVWSRRDKSRSQEAATVLATVNQFNAVSFRVISTILMDSDTKTMDRAAIISAWIDIAQVWMGGGHFCDTNYLFLILKYVVFHNCRS